MTNLKFVELSGCDSIEPDSFVKGISECTKLEQIVMRFCTQFSEWQIVEMCTSLPNLTYVDALG